VSIGGVRVEPGDVLVGDADGVVAVPAGRAAEVLVAAAEIRDTEDQIRRAVEAGKSLTDARAAFGYHKLQARR